MGSPYLVPVDPIMAISFHRKGDEWGITVGPYSWHMAIQQHIKYKPYLQYSNDWHKKLIPCHA